MLPSSLAAAIDSTVQPGDFAVFDFDHTCIKGDIGEALMNHLVAVGRLHGALLEEYESLLVQGRMREAYILYGEMLEGFTEDEVERAVRNTIDELGGFEVNTAARELIEYLKQASVAVWIVSASHESAVRMAAQSVGIEAGIIGIQNEIAGGVYTAQLKQPTSMFEGKVECMRTYIHPTKNPLLAIDDSPTGAWILETAKIKVVVDYGQPFAQEARKKGWFIV